MTDPKRAAPFPARFWASGDTYERIALAIILHSLVLVALIGVIVFVVMHGMMRDRMRREIEHGEMLIVQKLGYTLNSLQEDLAGLAANSLLVNALIDTEGNKAYVDPFIRSYRARGDLRLELTLCDYTGRPLSTNVRERVTCAVPEILSRTVEQGVATASVRKTEDGGKRLLLAYPVLWEGTGRPEGLLVAEVGIEDVIGDVLAGFQQSKEMGVVLRSGQETLYARRPTSGAPTQRLISALQAQPPVRDLRLEIEIDDFREIHLEGFITIYAVAALALLILAVFPARTLSRSLTTRLKQEQEERRRLEAQFQQAQKLESLGVLAGGIAHDFNNLLMGILGNADLALRKAAPGSDVREHLERIETTATRAAELTNQMLAYSGRGKFLVEPIDLSALVQEMGRLLETVISKRVQVRYALATDLPAVEVDVTQIRQVVMNLIINASDALGDQGGEILVATGRVREHDVLAVAHYLGEPLLEGPYAFIEIADRGSGMDQEMLGRIFDPFFTTKETGRGLGLAAVLGIVRGHKGGIAVNSEPGKGTSFKVLLPALATAAPTPTAGSAPSGGEVLQAPLPRRTILVVDDESTVREVARAMLEAGGYDVLSAADGEEALEVFRASRHGIAAVLLDLTMPRLSGEETCREMLRIDPGVRVLLSSGYSEGDATLRFSGANIAGFIQKPYRMQSLLGKIQEILEESAAG